jgi:hypothetical protein
MQSAACGTTSNRSIGSCLPQWTHRPYVPMRIRSSAASTSAKASCALEFRLAHGAWRRSGFGELVDAKPPLLVEHVTQHGELVSAQCRGLDHVESSCRR